MPGQLRMRRDHFDGLPEIETPNGYAVRTYRPGDEAHWARVVGSVEDLGHWDVEKTRDFLTEREQFDPESLFFAVYDDIPVATACAWRDRPGETSVGQMHMVAVAPNHQGKRLGALVSVAAIRYFERHDFDAVYLLTDDWRLAAVKTYLNLGFEPVMVEDDHPGRWATLRGTLGR